MPTPPDSPSTDDMARAVRAAAAVLDVAPSSVSVAVSGKVGRKRMFSDEQIATAMERAKGNIRAAARLLGTSDGTIRNRKKRRSPTGRKKR